MQTGTHICGVKDGVFFDRSLGRRCLALAFTRSEDAVLVADKSGDVYSYSTSNSEESGKLLLGHVSLLLDMVSLKTK